jgi:antitoxin component of MazEF toxin-antitoxin module
MEKSLTKIGNSMGFIIPKAYLEYLGDVVELEMTLNGLLIKPKKEKVLTLKELMATVNLNKLYNQMDNDVDDKDTLNYYNTNNVEFDNLDEIIDEY